MRRTVAAIVAVCLAACGAAAQDSSPRFQSGVDLVALNVVATDSKGKIVGGLASTEFAVFEDGHPQEISLFAVVPAPIDLALLLDTSASMTDKIGTVQQAAVGFTSVVRPTDRISIVEIKDAIRILHPLDNDVAAARKAIKSTVPRGNTSLYNGVYLTLREMQKQRRTDTEIRRQAIVLFSDGDDTTSLVAFDDLVGAGQARGRRHLHDLAPDVDVPDAPAVPRSESGGGIVVRDESAGGGNRGEGLLPDRHSGARRRVRHDRQRTGEPVPGRLYSEEPAAGRVVPAHQHPRRAARDSGADALRLLCNAVVDKRQPLRNGTIRRSACPSRRPFASVPHAIPI